MIHAFDLEELSEECPKEDPLLCTRIGDMADLPSSMIFGIQLCTLLPTTQNKQTNKILLQIMLIISCFFTLLLEVGQEMNNIPSMNDCGDCGKSNASVVYTPRQTRIHSRLFYTQSYVLYTLVYALYVP